MGQTLKKKMSTVPRNLEETIDQAKLASRAKITTFHGMKVKGVPLHTLVRGKFVMRDRQLVQSAKGHGCSVRRIQRMAPPKPQHTDQTMAAALARTDR